jgi:hypothetical protein
MSEYRPTIEEVDQLVDDLVAALNNHILVLLFNGISGPDDVDQLSLAYTDWLKGDGDPSLEQPFLTQHRKEAVAVTRRLLGVFFEIQAVVANGFQGVEEGWSRWVSIRDEHSHADGRFKDLRELAHTWGIDVVGVAELVRRGRPAVTSRRYTKETFWPAVRRAKERLGRRGNQKPTGGRIAQILNVSERYYYSLKKQYGPEPTE